MQKKIYMIVTMISYRIPTFAINYYSTYSELFVNYVHISPLLFLSHSSYRNPFRTIFQTNVFIQ